jgi:hypothetical protein
MSEENVELVRQGLEAFFVGDLERAMSSVHPDAVALRAPPLPDPQTYHGIEGVLQMYADWTTDFGEFEMAAGGVHRRRGPCRGRGLPARTTTSQWSSGGGPVLVRFTIADRKTIRYDVFNDRHQALKAAGLRD